MKQFQVRSFVGKSSVKLPYRLLRPENEEVGKRYPLVLFLHGAGERGSDNSAQLKWCVRQFLKPENRKQFPCFVVAPQCSKNERWAEVNWSDEKPSPLPKEPSKPMSLVIGLLDSLEQELKVDPERIYVAGLSMGGYGTWDLIARQPKRFAAAIPICGGGDPKTAKDLAHLSMWVFHGGSDNIVKPERSRIMIDALKSAGSTTVKYTEYSDVGHNSWTPAFNEPELFPWLFAQKKM